MRVTVYTPKSELLRQYIECFYTLTQEGSSDTVSYITFPNIYTIVAIVENAEFIIDHDVVTTRHSSRRPLESSIVARFRDPIYFSYTGVINEITIYFKPLAINFFLDKPLSFYSPEGFNRFNPYKDYEEAMRHVLAQPPPETRIELLESYWLSKFRTFNQPALIELVREIQHPNQHLDSSIEAMANRYGMSRKSIHALFQSYLGKSPGQFKKTLRFREAIATKMDLNEAIKLTHVAHDANYFDQSHMLKDFRSLTGQTPKEFFQHLSRVDKKRIYWQIQ